MDGNGRWAKLQGKSVNFGHRAGVRAIKRVMYACDDLGIEVLSIYAFSTENWSRSRREVGGLMRLFEETVQKEFDELHERGIRVYISGRRDGLSPHLVRMLEDAEERTRDNRRGVLNVCLNYGGRAEIVDAARRLVAEGVAAEAVDEKAIAERLYVPELADPDLVIRTANESRLSNFLLWQSAYSEFYVTRTLWPDFDKPDLEAAVAEYQRRERRFGGR
ncbi:MAG: di-trans,poly-cis-decaprenylcistransferase [Chloroflexi bacterium]|nr:MAG: di-trans,poly-cis-decaprenylcistransferase [Chloroflexota bacterium]